jgi:hypothetical protein
LSDSEPIDALPVLAEVSEVRPVQAEPPRTLAQRIVTLPAPVLAASAGFLAGVATFVLYRLRHPRGRKVRVGAGRGKKIEIAESRSFLVDIHLLKR